MYRAIYEGPNSTRDKIRQNAEQGRRTLLLCFYAGHGATKYTKTWALFNSNNRNNNQNELEGYLGEVEKE